MKPVICDAARTLRAMGRTPICTEDQHTIWHGMDTPALACGFHASARGLRLLDVFRGHRARMGETVTVTVLRENDSDLTFTIPTD